MQFLAIVALALVLSPFQEKEEKLDRPKRKPDSGSLVQLRATVAFSQLGLGFGAHGSFSGQAWFVSGVSRKYTGKHRVDVKDAAGAALPPADLAFQLDADEDAKGSDENIPEHDVPVALAGRIAASSEFALFPLRMLIPHHMEYGGSSGKSHKEVKAIGSTVEWDEERLGTVRIEGLTYDQLFTRSVRRFAGSSWEIHDYVLTVEEPKDQIIAGSMALRMFVNSTWKGKDGRPLEGGVVQLAQLACTHQEWMSEREIVPAADKAKLEQKFAQKLVDGLFIAMASEGVGDPFDSPAAVALAQSDLLDANGLGRLINIGNPKSLAMVVPLLAKKPFEFDPSSHLKLWRASDDPVLRLLYAAGAKFGGAKDPGFEKDLDLALQSKDPKVLRAAVLLATALGDPMKVADAEAALGAAR